eukprot:5283089-Pyramimonas_sp.AAC.1
MGRLGLLLGASWAALEPAWAVPRLSESSLDPPWGDLWGPCGSLKARTHECPEYSGPHVCQRGPQVV